MKLFIGRDTDGKSARFRIYDEAGREKYIVSGKYGVLGDTMRITDTNGVRLFKILQISTAFPITSFSLSGQGERVHLMYNQVRNSFKFIGISWHINGHEPIFEVLDVDKSIIMSQNIDPLSNGCKLDIFCQGRELLCIAVAISVASMPTITEISAQPT